MLRLLRLSGATAEGSVSTGAGSSNAGIAWQPLAGFEHRSWR